MDKKKTLIIVGIIVLVSIAALVVFIMFNSQDNENENLNSQDIQSNENTNDNFENSFEPFDKSFNVGNTDAATNEENSEASSSDFATNHPTFYNEQVRELKTENVLDREKMVTVAEKFAAAYFSSKDMIARKAALSALVDREYLEQENTSNILYMDYVLNDAQGYAINKDCDYGIFRTIGIDNASRENGIVRLEIDVIQHMKIQPDGEDDPALAVSHDYPYTATYQIYMNEEYKIRDIKLVKTNI